MYIHINLHLICIYCQVIKRVNIYISIYRPKFTWLFEFEKIFVLVAHCAIFASSSLSIVLCEYDLSVRLTVPTKH